MCVQNNLLLNFKIKVNLNTPVDTPLGDPIDLYAEASPLADAIPANNTMTLHNVVVASMDPTTNR